jgi:hypothetical protein
MHFNINDSVRVKLTEEGKRIFLEDAKHWRSQLPPAVAKTLPVSLPTTDADGYCSFPMWEFMRLYGPHLHLGCEIPFDARLRFNSEDLKQ